MVGGLLHAPEISRVTRYLSGDTSCSSGIVTQSQALRLIAGCMALLQDITVT